MRKSNYRLGERIMNYFSLFTQKYLILNAYDSSSGYNTWENKS